MSTRIGSRVRNAIKAFASAVKRIRGEGVRESGQGVLRRPTAERVADPLGSMWSELNWILREDPDEDYALATLAHVVASSREELLASLLPATAPPPEPRDGIDVDAILDEVRSRAMRKAGIPIRSAPDSLSAYLRELDGREPPPPSVIR